MSSSSSTFRRTEGWNEGKEDDSQRKEVKERYFFSFRVSFLPSSHHPQYRNVKEGRKEGRQEGSKEGRKRDITEVKKEKKKEKKKEGRM